MTVRPHWGTLIAAGLVIVALISAGGNALVRHVRPSAARLVWIPHEEPLGHLADRDAAALLQYINDTVQFVGGQRYLEAEGQLSVLKLVSVAPSVRQLLDLVGRQIEGLSTGMKDIDTTTAQAQALMQANRRAEARMVLIQVRKLLKRNGGFVQENMQSLLDLANRLGVPSFPANSPPRRVFERIQEALGLLDARERRIASLLAQIERGERVSLGPASTYVRWVVPDQAYPARPFIVSGMVTSGARSDVSRELVFDFDGHILGRLRAYGLFRATLTPPADFPPGWHALTVLVEANGPYAEFTETRALELTRYPITVKIEPVHMAWLPGAVTVSGQVTSAFGPLEHARIEVHLGNESSATDSTREGRFKVAVATPFGLDLVASHRIRVSVLSAAPWEAPTEVEIKATVVNLLNLGLASAMVPLAAVYIRTRRRRIREEETAWTHRTMMLNGVPAVADTWMQHVELRRNAPDDANLSSSARVIRLYATAVREIEEKKKVRLQPHMTLRDFQRVAAPALKGDALVLMTTLAELALYSSRSITGEQVAVMLRLRKEMDEELMNSHA